jgi:hypothetical protein
VRNIIRGAGATLVAAMLVSVATPVPANIVYSGVRNLTIPNTGIGLFVNVVNGTTYSGPSFAPLPGDAGFDYDFDIYGSALWGLYAPKAAGQSQPFPATSQTGFVSGGADEAARLAPGTLILPGSTFDANDPFADLLATGQPAIFGFRFRTESANFGDTYYGWARVILNNGVPGTLVDYAWESTPGVGLSAGQVVPEPATITLLAAAAIGLASRRRHT